MIINCKNENVDIKIEYGWQYFYNDWNEYICDTKLESSKVEIPIIKKIIDMAIFNLLYYFEDRYEDINEIDMTNNCTAMACWIEDICNELKVKCHTYTIYPGFSREAKLFNNKGFHYFNIIEYDYNKYLVDLTYKQFFKVDRRLISLFNYILPGYFMINDPSRSIVAKELLNKGYVKLSQNVLKHYCDGFAISYRNELYYREFGYSFNTNYSDDDYMNFLNEKDSQINHESIKYLKIIN